MIAIEHVIVISYEDTVETQKRRNITVAKQGPTLEKRSKARDKLL